MSELTELTLSQLARVCHEAEGTDNDLLLVEVSSEVERREREQPGTEWKFMEEYRRQMASRKKPNE